MALPQLGALGARIPGNLQHCVVSYECYCNGKQEEMDKHLLQLDITATAARRSEIASRTATNKFTVGNVVLFLECDFVALLGRRRDGEGDGRLNSGSGRRRASGGTSCS
jgi:hypothetical protein